MGQAGLELQVHVPVRPAHVGALACPSQVGLLPHLHWPSLVSHVSFSTAHVTPSQGLDGAGAAVVWPLFPPLLPKLFTGRKFHYLIGKKE